MPKIISPGIDVKPRPPWYVGQTPTCCACGCRWEIETGDEIIKVVNVRTPNGRQDVTLVCPNCERPVTLSRPGGGQRDSSSGAGRPYSQ